MRRLVLGTMVALAATQTVGCTSSSGGEDFGLITANWSFKQLATNTTIAQCPPGTSSADVHAILLDGAGNETSTVFIDKYTCDDNTGTSDYPLGVYKVFVDIVGYGQSLSAIVDITAADKTVSVTLVDDGGYFAFDWALVDSATNAPLTCSAAGNPDSIEITSTLSGTTQAVADKFDCEDGFGVTGALLSGSYTISVAALNASNQALGAVQNQSNVTIGDHNDVTDLGTITLPID